MSTRAKFGDLLKRNDLLVLAFYWPDATLPGFFEKLTNLKCSYPEDLAVLQLDALKNRELFRALEIEDNSLYFYHEGKLVVKLKEDEPGIFELLKDCIKNRIFKP